MTYVPNSRQFLLVMYADKRLPILYDKTVYYTKLLTDLRTKFLCARENLKYRLPVNLKSPDVNILYWVSIYFITVLRDLLITP